LLTFIRNYSTTRTKYFYGDPLTISLGQDLKVSRKPPKYAFGYGQSLKVLRKPPDYASGYGQSLKVLRKPSNKTLSELSQDLKASRKPSD